MSGRDPGMQVADPVEYFCSRTTRPCMYCSGGEEKHALSAASNAVDAVCMYRSRVSGAVVKRPANLGILTSTTKTRAEV